MAETQAGTGNSYVIIPARLASTRLPRKLLLKETGKSLLQHTYEAAQRALRPSGVCVAADHEEIAAEVRSFGGEVELTDPQAASGTDRIAELARNDRFRNIDVIVNVQGDEPDLSGAAIDLAIQLLQENPAVKMATLATPIRNKAQLADPACVKVVFDQSYAASSSVRGGRALYFSRSQIPFAREWNEGLLTADPPYFHQHIGLYAYRREFLLQLADMPRTPHERLESLEQLRVLEQGHSILVGVVDEPSIGIDTPADYEAFVRKHRADRLADPR